MPASIHFYRDLLGFELVETSKPLSADPEHVNWALMRHSGVTSMLNTAYEPDCRPPVPDPSRTAAHREASLYFGCPDVDGVNRELAGQGVAVEEPVLAPYGMKQLNVTDPDGYHLCFQWPSGPCSGTREERCGPR